MQYYPIIDQTGYTNHTVKAASDDHARRKIKGNLIQEGFLSLYDSWKENGMQVTLYEGKTFDEKK